MNDGSGDREEALSLCEHSLGLISRANDWTELEAGSRIGHWSDHRFRTALLVPPEVMLEGACIPHVLEIWDENDKVLSACWEDPQQLEVRLFRRGDWEAAFLAR